MSSKVLHKPQIEFFTNAESSIPILALRLLDIKMPDDPITKKLLLNGAKDLLKSHRDKVEDMDINVFHNKEVVYSGIQLEQYQQSPEWTAIGQEAVHALRMWYALFIEEHPIPLRNTVEIIERYTPEFLAYQKKYYLPKILISDDIAKELNEVKDASVRYDRIERYLYGNIQTFFKYIGFSYSKETYFLKLHLQAIKPYNQSLRVYHYQKKTAFDITFSCNFRLPQTFRIGQSTALGYGKVYHL